MIDVCLLVDIARQHMIGEKSPETVDDAKKVFGLCFDVLRLQEYYDTIHHEKIGGSETRVKQVFAEYLKQMHKRNSGDS